MAQTKNQDRSPALIICSALLFYWVVALSNKAVADTVFSADELSAITLHGPWPQSVPADPGNELSGLAWAENVGQLLFFDKALSTSQSVSCATCHEPAKGFSDALAVAEGAQRGLRNSQSLFDVGLQHWFGWDGGADSLWAASMRPMLAEHEMAGTVPHISSVLRNNVQFRSALQQHVQALQHSATAKTNTASQVFDIAKVDDTQLVVLAAKSIAAFTRTIQSKRTPFDLFRDAVVSEDIDAIRAYPESAKRGLKLFLGEANCSVCHFGPDFSNGEFHDTGRPFFTAVGQVDPGRYTGIQRVRNDPYNLLGEYAVDVSNAATLKTARVKLGQANWGQWRTPSLRSLNKTAPYMHDGSLATLRDVVDAYADIDPDRLHADGESILKPLQLTNEQREDLVAFLKSLSASD